MSSYAARRVVPQPPREHAERDDDLLVLGHPIDDLGLEEIGLDEVEAGAQRGLGPRGRPQIEDVHGKDGVEEGLDDSRTGDPAAAEHDRVAATCVRFHDRAVLVAIR